MKILALLIVLISLTNSAFAAPKSEVYLKEGMNFFIAKKNLMRNGWAARKMHFKHEYTYIGFENILKKDGVNEIQSCTVDSPTLCIMHYLKNGKCLRVMTKGENIDDLTVDYWDNECPPEYML